jgi:hypothetical protein
MDISVFGKADRVHVLRVGNGVTRDLSDPALIDGFYRLVASQPNNWVRIRFDAPVLSYQVEFFQGAKDLGGYGVIGKWGALELYPYALHLKVDQRQSAVQLERISFSAQ